MKIYITLLLLLVAAPLQGVVSRDRCDSTDTEKSLAILYKDAPIEKVSQKVRPQTTFTSGARVVCMQRGNLEYPRKLLDYQVEFGVRDGFGYRLYYSDGSGSLTEAGKESDYLSPDLWAIGCKVDSMDDSKVCYLHKGALFAWYAGGEKWSVHVGDGRNSPKTDIAVRIGDGEAIRGEEPEFSLEKSRKIVEALKSELRVRTRFFKWPSGIGEDEFDAKGFKVALELIKWLYASLQP
jgi:hypothetical protein